MNIFSSKTHAPSTQQLLLTRARQLRQRLYNLKAADVLECDQYKRTLDFIRQAILFRPVVFEKPTFVGCRKNATTRLLGKLRDGFRDIIIHHVSFPFTGSIELLKYTPYDVHIPEGNYKLKLVKDCITIKFREPFLSRREALKAARKIASPIFRMVAANNRLAIAWSATAGQQIESELEKYRSECERIYNPNG